MGSASARTLTRPRDVASWTRERLSPDPRRDTSRGQVLRCSAERARRRAQRVLRRTPVPVVHLDFLSMYPTVNALMELWPLLIAERLRVVDATARVRQLGQSLSLERCFSKDFWTELRFFARIRP